MKFWASAFLLVFVLCIGCGSKFKTHKLAPEPTSVRSYEMGETLRVAPGERLFRVYNASQRPIFAPTAPMETPQPSSFWALPNLSLDQRWVMEYGVLEEDGIIVTLANVNFGIHLIPVSDTEWEIGKGWIRLFDQQPLGEQKWEQPVKWKRIGEDIVIGDFVAELLFAGISGESIRLIYREYIDNVARPAFFYELTYNRSDSRIQFRDIEIEVIDVTNQELVFKVKSDKGLKWLPLPKPRSLPPDLYRTSHVKSTE